MKKLLFVLGSLISFSSFALSDISLFFPKSSTLFGTSTTPTVFSSTTYLTGGGGGAANGIMGKIINVNVHD